MTGLIDAALAYAAHGWPVFPCAPGTKMPLIPRADGGRGVLDATTDPGQIRAWWQSWPDANIGLATGLPGPDVLDIDVKPDGNGFDALADLAARGLIDGNLGAVATPSGGRHIYFPGSSQRNGRIAGRHVDYRAAGGYVIAPHSHIGGTPYQQIAGPDGNPAQQADWHAMRALLDPPPDPAPTPRSRNSTGPADNEGRPGDDYSTRASWPEILQPHGWRIAGNLGDGRLIWTRPGKTRGTSATTRDDGGLYVFSTSTPFDIEVPYSKFGAYAVLNHDGDHAVAARALRLAGYGAETTTASLIADMLPLPPKVASGPSDEPGQPASEPTVEHTSWYPRDLQPILDGDENADPKPCLLERDDGEHLVYRGKVNALIGESESGKTWIALHAVAQCIGHGGHVVYLDFEDAPAGITGRLRALGVTGGQLAKQFRYIAPDEPLHIRAAADLYDALADPVPDLVIVDGVNAAMTLLGLDLDRNKDVTEFSQRVLKPIKRTGAGVLTVDHVGKNKETRGNYAIGAQAKRADVDGASFIVSVEKAFGRGMTGRLKMTVSKDRPGHVRAISLHGKYAGTAVLTSRDDGTVTLAITAPDSTMPADGGTARDPFRPTGLMRKVSDYLAGQQTGISKAAVERGVSGMAKYVRQALDRLIAEGYVITETGPRGGISCRLDHPFTETDDLIAPTSSHLVSTSSDLVSDEVRKHPVTSSMTSSPPRNVVTGDEVDEVALAVAPRPGDLVSQNTLEYGGCDNCGDRIIKYGPRSIGRLCDHCKPGSR